MKKIVLIIWYTVLGSFFRILPIKKNRIVISSFFGKGFGDSVKYIAGELIGRGGYEIIWLVSDLNTNGFPKEIKKVKRRSLSGLYYLSTARVWIDNSRKPYGLKKRKSQFYLQTWHSSLRLKKIEKDAEPYLSANYIRAAKNDSKMIDLITSGCRFSTNIYKNSFWYGGEVLECGTPRCDMLLDDEKSKSFREKICRQYGIDSSKRLVLYAPTFRKDKILDDRYLNCDEFANALGNKYEVVMKLHPHMSNVETKSGVVNASKYPDMQELICAVDYLITDYSGCCFDMMIAKKPCILYVPDLKQYLDNERELYFTFDELPFKKTTSIKELVSVVKNFDKKEYAKDIEKFGECIGLCEKGNATKTIADLIAKKCEGADE